ncbi:MAG: hypothetical protein BHW44_04435 [Roseburia sp. 40_7]|nr:MAG: hypothetical protein BHW44_04435 [Roseburia sp. 40_7]
MEVIGMGENKTPKSFKAACSVFTSLEILLEQDTDKAKENISQKTIEEAIVEIITENENNGRKTGLGELGSSLLKKYSDFDVRNYGYSSLSKFIEEMEDTFILYKKENTILVKLRDDNLKREQLEAYIRECVEKSNGEGVDLAAMGQKLHKKYPDLTDHRVRNGKTVSREKRIRCRADDRTVAEDNCKKTKEVKIISRG